MKRLFLATTLACAPLTAQAQEQTFRSAWNYKGSGVIFVVTGIPHGHGLVDVIFDRPRPYLINWGISPGSLSFHGEIFGDVFRGQSYTYAQNCPPFTYRVEGTLNRQERSLTLRGPAPVVNAYCQIYGYTTNNPNAVKKYFWIQDDPTNPPVR